MANDLDKVSRASVSGVSPFDALKHVDELGEYWIARELMGPLGYKKWQKFKDAIERAMIVCRSSGFDMDLHFLPAPVNNSQGECDGPGRPKGTGENWRLTRYACYLIAQCGDVRKAAIAYAMTYFAVRTHQAEQMLKGAVAPQYRPWSSRISESFEEHYRYVVTNYPGGHWTMLIEIAVPMMVTEDCLLDHNHELQTSDLMDNSAALCYRSERKRKGLPPITRTAPLQMPKIKVNVNVYTPEERGDFSRWFHEVYVPTLMPEYLRKKFQKEYGRLPPLSAANAACQRLIGSPAQLAAKDRLALTQHGGVMRATPALA